MKNFIKNGLINARNKNNKTFDFQYERDDGDIISMKGSICDGNASFIIERTKVDGHKCSAVTVHQMPLTDKLINEIAEIAAEAL